MDNLLRLLLRVLLVPLGIVVGMIATMVVIMVGYWRIGDLLSGAVAVQAPALFDALAAASFALMAVMLAMWAVAAIGILFAEMFAIRSWIFHAANGAVSALVAAALFSPYPDTPVPFDDGTLYILGAGLAGGLAYWLVAGWTAGFWKPLGTPRPAAPPGPPAAGPNPPAPPAPPAHALPAPAPTPAPTPTLPRATLPMPDTVPTRSPAP
ncbi:hypothetical protein [Ancylobacter mangrovi]|uniref:hypothetical protein n=1 Tax=Ancylobacter mangrovi TaxID=2972472 RepID=UPI0021638AC2|nr:hypothetical protein [Ancylobacter mangrovi]MCS0504900.1 hypothetical protein [Ancylobacter mangrovi]